MRYFFPPGAQYQKLQGKNRKGTDLKDRDPPLLAITMQNNADEMREQKGKQTTKKPSVMSG